MALEPRSRQSSGAGPALATRPIAHKRRLGLKELPAIAVHAMGLLSFLRKDSGLGLDELARRLGLSFAELTAVTPSYRRFTIPKRRGGTREIHAPSPALKAVQRRILRRVLMLLVAHEAVTGFERGKSIVMNARPHLAKAVVVKMDLKEFFTSTPSNRVREFFAKIGWNRAASQRLTDLCTHNGSLPQGAPTSPRLANLVNFMLDKRLARAAVKYNADYTRYADDLTFSFALDERRNVQSLISLVSMIVADEGYQLHMKKKLNIRRRHDQQRVTGLVVNQRINLSRQVCRKLRAIEHHHRTGRPASLTPAQMEGWTALRSMIAIQGR